MTAMAQQNLDMFVDSFELLEEDIEKLKTRAEALGIEITEKAEKAEIIEALVEASMTEAKAQQEPEAGILIALHSRDEEAKALIREANERITVNQHLNPPRLFNLLLRNREGELYGRTAPGVRVSKGRLPQILRLVVLPPDESQKQILEDFKKDPQGYQEPVLVRVKRRNRDGSTGNYVMLYIRKKTESTAEVVF